MQSENGNQFDTDVLANGMAWTTYGMDVLLRKISLPQIFSLWYFFIFRAKTNKWIPGAKCYRTYFCPLFFFKWFVMHQSIPAVPIPPPPPGNHWAFAHIVSPGGGTFAILSWHGGWAFAYPEEIPGHLTLKFLKVSWMSSAEKTRCLWRNGLFVTD